MKLLQNLKIGGKLLSGFLIISSLILIVTFVGYTNMNSINNGMNSMYQDRLIPIEILGEIETNLYKMRGDVFKYIMLADERQTVQEEINGDVSTVNDLVTQYKENDLVQEETDLLLVFEDAWINYQGQVEKIINNINVGNETEAISSVKDGGDAANARKSLGTAINNIVELNKTIASDTNDAGKQTFNNSMILLLAVCGVGVILAISLGQIISKSITNPLNKVMNVATQISEVDLKTLADEINALSQGDLTRGLSISSQSVQVSSKDEIGQLGQAFNTIISRLKETGTAFEVMTNNLHGAIIQVSNSAASVGVASTQLAAAATQAEQATNQIATTVQQVAKGTTQQSESVTRTAASVEEMARAIDGVAKGAQEQSRAIAKASNITSEISNDIKQVAGNVSAVTKDSAVTTDVANRGSKMVEDTIEGMQSIKSKVDFSSQKVQEMGQRSEQIGVIVETIEDIASQTNLLALNAAIEAARAGEHGKGFAVVADEVRKLAERSSSATKEIGALIKGIQATVSDAVTAMQESAQEVEAGVSLADQSGQALNEILTAAKAVLGQAEEAGKAAAKMSAASDDLVASMDSVSAVVEENTAATEEMAAGSNEVTQAIENIASVSEENSAAIEEVSASAEEMSAQVEEVTASAQSLAEMAHTLQQVVARFKLEDDANLQMSKQATPTPSNTTYIGPDRRAPMLDLVDSNASPNGHKVKIAE